jgi:hypothetical protein
MRLLLVGTAAVVLSVLPAKAETTWCWTQVTTTSPKMYIDTAKCKSNCDCTNKAPSGISNVPKCKANICKTPLEPNKPKH